MIEPFKHLDHYFQDALQLYACVMSFRIKAYLSTNHSINNQSFQVKSNDVFFFLGSLMSLMSGLLFGLILAFGATQTSQNPKNIWLVLSKYSYFL